MHPQVRVHNAAVLERRHTRCARGVVQRLHVIPAVLLDLGVGRVAEPVLQLGVGVACGIDHRRDGLGTRDLLQELDAAHEDFDVVLVGEVPGIEQRSVRWVIRSKAEDTMTLWPGQRVRRLDRRMMTDAHT